MGPDELGRESIQTTINFISSQFKLEAT